MFGERVRAHRRRLGWTQEELASATGISVRSVGKLEAGLIATPRPATVRLLADAFGLTADDRELFCRAAAGEAIGQWDRTPNQLPADVRGFVGRDAELALLDDVLGNPGGSDTGGPAIGVISGTAGLGKSALAVHWAHRAASRFPGGQLYVNLRGFDPGGQLLDPSAAIRGFLDSLGVSPQRIPANLDAQAAMYRSLIAGKHMLVVADNARDEQQVRPLLPGTPTTVVVVTSRSQLTGLLAVDGARPITLGHLSAVEARELLRRRLGDSRTDDEPQAVGKIITACAGLPLALAIAAARAQQASFPLTMLAAELDAADRRLDTLDAGEPASQVRAVISWSYTTMTPLAARLFRLLGLHPGPDIHTAGAASLANLAPSAARQLLTELTRASLLTEHTLGRYTFHDLLRAYAGEQARVHDTEQEQRAALTSLFDYYLAGAAAAMDALFPAEKHRRPHVPTPTSPVPPLPSLAAARDWLNAERASLVAVTTHAVGDWPAHAVLLASTLYRYFETGGHHLDAQVVFAAALEAARKTGDLAAQADLLKNLGVFDTEQGLYRRGAAELRSALELYRQIGDQPGQAMTLQELGLAEDARGRVGQAARQLRQALAISREIGDRLAEGHALINLGDVTMRQGIYEGAISLHWEALVIFRELGDRLGEAFALGNLGEVLRRQGRCHQAEDHLHPALAIFRELGSRSGEASVLQSLGHTLREQARCQEAAGLIRQALGIFREAGERLCETEALNSLGEALLAGGLPAQACAQHHEALAIARQIGACYEEARAHDGLAHTYRAAGDQLLARQHWQHALAIYTRLGLPEAKDVRAGLKDPRGEVITPGHPPHRRPPSR
jgi:tetratricopeptide (TPR) repeat protein/transcriptional regulator with XRE-family HTH domain